jgi:hypothetical protein
MISQKFKNALLPVEPMVYVDERTTGEIEDRYIFDDSSTIIITEQGWGIEGKTPWSWKVVTFRDKG